MQVLVQVLPVGLTTVLLLLREGGGGIKERRRERRKNERERDREAPLKSSKFISLDILFQVIYLSENQNM